MSNDALQTTEKFQIVVRRIRPDETIDLRHRVLWPEKDPSYVILPEDDSGLHFGAFILMDGVASEPKPAAVIPFFLEPPPPQSQSYAPTGRVARFRKFATEPDMQARGIGSQLLSFACEEVKRTWDASYIWCDARVASKEWYHKRGLREIGGEKDRFFKEHIPYLRMGKVVDSWNAAARVGP